MKRRSLLRSLGFGALITAINSLFPESALAAPTTKHWFERPVCSSERVRPSFDLGLLPSGLTLSDRAWTQTCCNLQN